MSGRTPEALVLALESEDFDVRARALAELVGHGAGATPALLPLLTAEDAMLRLAAARALSEVGDGSASGALVRALGDADERVRAHAAVGLDRLDHPKAMDALACGIDDAPDVLRAPFTPAVDALIARGLAALAPVARHLDAPAPDTRGRAFLVVREVLARELGQDGWQRLERSLGRFEPRDDPAVQGAVVARWRAWLEGVQVQLDP